MPYRDPQDVLAPTVVVLCVACAKPTELTAREQSFRCAACDRTQPAVREDAAAPLVNELVTFQGSGHDELVAFASSMGVPSKCAQVTVRCDGLECEVTLDLNSGRSVGIDLTARTSGLPTVAFTRESAKEKRAKADGLSREAQTGDREFDAKVYIDTDVRDEDLSVILRSPAVRAAIVTLLEEFTSIKLSPTGVALTGSRDEPACYEPGRIVRQLAALRVVAGAPRPLAPSSVARSALNRVTPFLAMLGVPSAIASFVFAMVVYEPLGAMLVGLGAAPGLALAAAVQPLLRWMVKGYSDSHRDLAMMRTAAVLSLPVLGAAVAVAANGAFDRSDERVSEMRIVRIEWDSEDYDTIATLHGVDTPILGEVEIDFDDDARRVRVGDSATVYTKSGALGYRWFTRPAIARLRASGHIVTQE